VRVGPGAGVTADDGGERTGSASQSNFLTLPRHGDVPRTPDARSWTHREQGTCTAVQMAPAILSKWCTKVSSRPHGGLRRGLGVLRSANDGQKSRRCRRRDDAIGGPPNIISTSLICATSGSVAAGSLVASWLLDLTAASLVKIPLCPSSLGVFGFAKAAGLSKRYRRACRPCLSLPLSALHLARSGGLSGQAALSMRYGFATLEKAASRLNVRKQEITMRILLMHCLLRRTGDLRT